MPVLPGAEWLKGGEDAPGVHVHREGLHDLFRGYDACRRTLNLGILAHVNAGKTTLTERLLYLAGVIDRRQRRPRHHADRPAGPRTPARHHDQGRGDVLPRRRHHVNLIDTPGHPDFIAEVERALSVLDGAVLVISAVEGVQPQTRILMRALRRLRIPTLLFVNKMDRRAPTRARAAGDRRAADPKVVPIGGHERGPARGRRRSRRPTGRPSSYPETEVLAEQDDEILAAYVGTGRRAVRAAPRSDRGPDQAALLHPVYVGSAVTGAGVASDGGGWELLPAAPSDAGGAVSGRSSRWSGVHPARKSRTSGCSPGRCTYATACGFGDGLGEVGKVTALDVFERGSTTQRPSVAGELVARLWGLHEIQIGDRIGATRVPGGSEPGQFAPPTLEAAVVARDPAERARLRVALAQLAEQDPLIDVEDRSGRTSRRPRCRFLYGEVQKQVIEATLAADYGIEADFPGDDDDLRRASRGLGRGDGEPGCARQSVFRHGQVAAQPGAGRLGGRVPAGRRQPEVADVRLQDAATSAETITRYVGETLREGLARLAGHRLRGDDVRVRLHLPRVALGGATTASSRRWS